MTVDEAYRAGVLRLQDAHTMPKEESRSAARIALDAVCDVRYAHLSQPDRVLLDDEEQRWNSLLDELAKGRPLSYLIGEREFLGLKFRCDERALIPRPETEAMVEAAAARLKEHSQPRVADLGTGAGGIAIGIAHLLPAARVWATDVSTDALALAQENAVRLKVDSRITFVPGAPDEWAAPILNNEPAHSFDAILANPPYISRAILPHLATQVKDWEPEVALDGGADGLASYRHIAAQCGELLKPDGFMMVELGDGLFTRAQEVFEAAGWETEEPLLDLQGIERAMPMRRRCSK